MAETWISVNDAAREFNYHPDHLRELIRAGKIKARKFATVWQIDRVSLATYIRQQAKQGEKRGPKKE